MVSTEPSGCCGCLLERSHRGFSHETCTPSGDTMALRFLLDPLLPPPRFRDLLTAAPCPLTPAPLPLPLIPVLFVGELSMLSPSPPLLAVSVLPVPALESPPPPRDAGGIIR